MTQLRFLPASFTASAIFFFSSFAGAVAAPPAGCGTGPTCGQGFECTVVGTSGCAPVPACPPGQVCTDPAPCTETQELGCTPAHCSADSDCASGMLCHVWEEPCAVSDCACASDQPNCDCGPQPACDPATVSICTPRYLLPCETATDCGNGFSCEVAPVNCACGGSSAGSAPTPPPTPGASPEAAGGAPDGNDAAPVPDPACTCDTGTEKQCVVKAMNCQSSAECPAGWTCEQEATTANAPACAGKDCDIAPPTTTSTSSCRPPYYGGKGVDPEVPGGTPISSNGGGTGTTTGGGTAGGTTKPETKATDDAHESSACSMGHAPASSGALAMLAMLGALFGLKRRRN